MKMEALKKITQSNKWVKNSGYLSKITQNVLSNLFIIIVVLSAIGFFYFGEGLWKSFCTIILTSGIFGAFFRWFSFQGIVKSEVEDIIYGKEYLSKRDNASKLLENILDISIEKHAPQLKGVIQAKHLLEYLPSKNELLYKEYRIRMHVTPTTNPDIYKIEEISEISACTASKDSKHNIRYNYTVQIPEKVGDNASIEKLTLNEDDITDIVKTESTKVGDDDVVSEVSYDIELQGSETYRIYKKMVKYVNVIHEPFIVTCFRWNTINPQVTVHCPEDIIASFRSVGMEKNFRTNDGANGSSFLCEKFVGVILKNQGYVLCFSKV